MTRTKSEIGRSNRTTGHQFERTMAIKLRRWFPRARRGLQYQDGECCPDIVRTPLYIECKKRTGTISKNERAKFYRAAYVKMQTWREETGNDLPVVLIWKRVREPIMVATPRYVMENLGVNYERPEYPSDSPVEASWENFAEALDKFYPIQGGENGNKRTATHGSRQRVPAQVVCEEPREYVRVPTPIQRDAQGE